MASLGAAPDAGAQARTYPAGVGSVTLGYQQIRNTGHRLSDGSLLVSGESRSRAVMAEVAYGISDRLTVSAALPFVASQYTSRDETPFRFLANDADRRWHGTFQDVALNARFELIERGGFALAPSVTVVAPSHAYEYQGEAVAGRRLRELQLGLAASRTLTALSPRLSIDAAYGYAIVEKGEVAVPDNRSNAAVGVSYVLTPKLSLDGGARWQRTHGGLRVGSFTGPLWFPGEFDTPGRQLEHDRLLRDNYAHLEGGISYSVGAVDLSGSYLHYLSGTDTHAGRAVTVAATWFFGALR